MPYSSSSLAAFKQLFVGVPYPNKHACVPSRNTWPFPTSKGTPLYPGLPTLTPSNSKSRPIPGPRGYRKQDGQSSIAKEVAIIWHSSASFLGAITTMSGRQAIKVISYAPACVGPSAPTKPARSMAKRTGNFWSATS